MNTAQKRGFTLVELLTVIAIIAILASITAVALPRALERAKIARVTGAAQEIHKALVSYYTSNSSYPPAYGYLKWGSRDKPANQLNASDFHLKPYLAYVNLHRAEKLYDEFSLNFGFDANRNGQLGLLEFSPIGFRPNPAVDTISFVENARYNGNNIPQEVQAQLNAEQRPMIYIPVNKSQFQRAKRYWLERGDFLARSWDPNDPLLQNMYFPPAEYDDYVLISMGPAASTFGVVPDATGNEPVRDVYHILALRAFFLATRDLNENGQRDFDFLARTRLGEGNLTYTWNGQNINSSLPFPEAPTNQLPDPTQPNGAGPLIFKF